MTVRPMMPQVLMERHEDIGALLFKVAWAPERLTTDDQMLAREIVIEAARRATVSVPRASRPGDRRTSRTKAEALRLMAGGLHFRDVAVAVGASERQVRRWRDDARREQRSAA